jgi:type II secretion system protein D
MDGQAGGIAGKIELAAVKASRSGALRQAVELLKGQRPRAVSVEGPGGMVQAQQPAPGVTPGVPLVTSEGGAIGPVDIEFLEGTGVIVLRGHERDVARVRQLIAEIEKLSAETEPKIVVRPMMHVNSESIAALLNQLYQQVYFPRQGLVSITPLVTPNAILVVGREDNVNTVLELAGRLDLPVDALAQSRIFPLRHASAVEVKATIDNFFARQEVEQQQQPTQQPQQTLAMRVRVTADFRSNSLIVQASPRDMAEVELLIQRLDTATSESENELRVFTLENALAVELAEVLRQAISTQAPGAAPAAAEPVPVTPRATPAGDGPRGAPTPAAPTTPRSRSAALKFLLIDPEGQKRLRSGILTDVTITADPRANTLLVSAPSESMELIAALVRTLDQIPGADVQIKVFTVVNGDATGLVEMLERLFGQTTANQPGAAGASGTGSLVERPLVTMRFSVDARTNSIIASGSDSDLGVVEAILLRLDASDISQRQTAVYRLKNAPAQEVSDAINEFLTSRREVQDIAPETASPFEQIEREVVVVPEVVSNSLIVSATPRYFEEIRKVVEELDERPPMVMIQVLIAEVALNDADEFGVELGIQDGLLFDRSLVSELELIETTTQTTTPGGGITSVQQQTIVSSLLNPGFNFNTPALGNSGGDRSLRTSDKVAGQALSNFAVGRTSDLGYGGLVLSAGSENINVLIRALQETRRLEILSRPQIMTLDNQPAYIQVGQQVPRVIGTAVELGVQQNTIQDEDVGIILGVVPRISPDGLVVMMIDATKSEVGPEAEGIPVSISATGDVIRSPRIDRTFAQTTVSAASGQTIVLGGLITKSAEDIHRRVPLLSDIPLLGHLFRFDSARERKTELLIIMTPHIVRNAQDAERIKQVEAARMSWCLADVIELHGDAGLRSRSDAWGDDETTTIYPELELYDAEQLPPPAAPVPGAEVPELPAPAYEPAVPGNGTDPTMGPSAGVRRGFEPALWRESDPRVTPAGHQTTDAVMHAESIDVQTLRLPPVTH